MNATVVHYSPAQQVTCEVTSDIEAGKLVEIAATLKGRNPVVKPATAGAKAFGVVAHSATSGGVVTVYRSGHIVDLVATGSIAAGDEVACGAGGKVVKATESNPRVGLALSTGGATVTVALY